MKQVKPKPAMVPSNSSSRQSGTRKPEATDREGALANENPHIANLATLHVKINAGPAVQRLTAMQNMANRVQRFQDDDEPPQGIDAESRPTLQSMSVESNHDPAPRFGTGTFNGQTRSASQAAIFPYAQIPQLPRKASGSQSTAQRSPKKDFTKHGDKSISGSSFNNTGTKNELIYMIYKKSDDLVYYVGKTSQGIPTRFNQHKSAKGLDADYEMSKLVDGTWTPFETATHEQYWIGECNGKKNMLNKYNALTTKKWNWFKTPTGEHQNKNQETDLTDGHFT